MVRVISVHHFHSQIIKTCEEPLAATAAQTDRILTALSHHVIEVHDLNEKSLPPYSFPTVDRVSELHYCASGNYVGTLEKKQTRQGREVTYARVYTNWDKRPETDSEQAMRARIAGRVTPSSSQIGADVLEMIELPVRFPNITTMACCQETGNILIGSENIVCLFQLVTRIHDISRQKFLDFELWPVTLELSFPPSRLAMSEDVVAALNTSCLHVFRVNKGFARPSDWSSASAQSSPRRPPKLRKPRAARGDKKNVDPQRPPSPIRLDDLLKEVSEVGGKQHETSKLANGPLPVVALLPSLTSSSLANNPARNLRTSPFKPPSAVTMGVAIREIPANEPWAEQMTTMVESLLQLELGDWGDEIMKEEFKCMALRPLYRVDSYPSKNETSCPRMRSTAYGNLVAFNCVVCTQQEGYMYHFPVSEGEVLSLGKCISEYNFTSAVKHIILEPCLLHALTTTGLETYTMRAVRAIDEEDDELASPPIDEPVCLVGLRPFIGVVDVLLTKSFVVIMSSSSDPHAKYESHEETLYCLRLPSACTVYTDMMALGSSHRFSSPQTYWQLLTEAHSVLRTITSVSSDPDHSPVQVEVELYRESCALLADYYLCSYDDEEDWSTGYKYSMMAKLSPIQVMDRLKKLEVDAKRAGCNVKYSGGLLYYLKQCLINCDDDAKMPVGALNTLLDMIETTRNPGKSFLLSTLILESSILRQYSTERTIRMISNNIRDSKTADVVDCLALAVLYISKGKVNEAGDALGFCDDPVNYVSHLNKFWPLLFDNSRKQAKVTPEDWEGVTLSELAVLLIDKKPSEMSFVLSGLVTESKILKMQDILEVFLVYLPARMGQEGTKVGYVLQLFLERVFDKWYQTDPSLLLDSHSKEALKILIRSLLSGLVGKGESKVDVKSQPGDPRKLFGGKRHKFLDLLPPCDDPEFVPENHVPLMKLQCLMCTKWLDESATSEIVQFVGEFIETNYGFSVMVLAQPQKAVDLLLDNHPTALLQYVQDLLTTEAELKHVVSALQTKADEEADHPEDGPKTFTEILDTVLNHLARTLNCETFNQIVPPGKEFDCYKVKCRQAGHANHIKEMIMVSGHRLMATMNLKSFT